MISVNLKINFIYEFRLLNIAIQKLPRNIYSMKFLIIIPLHNEEEYIISCLESLEKQSYQDFDCILIDDGSTDKSGKIIEEFISKESKFQAKYSLFHLPESSYSPGSKVVLAFNEGVKKADLKNYDVICKFDADIIFPASYLEELAKIYQNFPEVGMASGLVQIQNSDGKWIFESLSSKNHVRGPIKSYRKKCFEDIGGLRPVLGWDNIDVMLAEMHGWKVATIKNLWVKHLRPTAFKYKKDGAKKMGEYFYNIGLDLPLATLSAAKYSLRNSSFVTFFQILNSFIHQQKKRALSSEEMKFIRRWRWKQIFRLK